MLNSVLGEGESDDPNMPKTGQRGQLPRFIGKGNSILDTPRD
jgi:hypothetical protein